MSGSRLRPLLVALAATATLAGELRAQEATVPVRGTVVNVDNGEPVEGASVVIAGTRIGTLSNARGEFTFRVRALTDTLVVSRIGYVQQRVPLAGQATVTVRLTRTALTLSDVVVVGYGTQKRSDITGSVTSITPEKLEGKPNTNVLQALEGALPGVNVATTGAGAEPTLSIDIRGRNSITASNAPLIVVDGIPYFGSFSEINPNDIASIEILKDASAAAIYGSRASNGVILITSKKGSTGKPRVSYSAYAGRQEVSNTPTLMNAEQFADFKCVRLRTAATQSCDAVLTATELTNRASGVNTDWLDVGTQTGDQMQHDLSVSGGSEDTKYYLAGSILGVNGIARNDNFDRVTVRLNLDQKLWSWLTVGTSTQGARTNRAGARTNFEAAFFANPLISPFDSAGRIAIVPWREDPVTNNPLEPLLATSDDINKRLFSSNYVLVTVPRVTGLTYRLNAGFDLADRNSGSYYGRNTQTGLAALGIANVSNTVRTDYTLENILGYTRALGKSDLSLTGVYSTQSSDLESRGFNGRGFPNDVLGYRSTLPTLAVPSNTVTTSRQISQMGRVNYTYDSRYLATVTVRRDGYSGFGANHKYGVFPVYALGWNLSNERFFPFKETVDVLKLRASYGTVGNQAVAPYQTLARLDDRSYVTGDVPAPGYYPVALGNPDLRWESTRSFNVGADFGLWKDRVTGSVDAYTGTTTDLLLDRAISPVHGITRVLQNLGETQNRGVELQLSAVTLDRGGFQWRTSFNVSANRNKIVDLYGDGSNDIGNGWFIGQPIDVNYGYRFDGIWQTSDSASGMIAASAQPTARPGYVRVKDTNGDGKIDAADRTLLGGIQPDYSAGLTNTVRFKRFTASAYVHTVQGTTRSNILLGTNQVQADVRRNTVLRQYWTPQNPINTYPSNSNNSNPLSVGFYEDASFVRLRDVSLAYDLPAALSSRLGAQSLGVYVNGRNLWTSTRWTGLDPQLTSQRAVPLERSFIGGVNLRF